MKIFILTGGYMADKETAPMTKEKERKKTGKYENLGISPEKAYRLAD